MGFFARGSIYTTILELAPQNHDEDGLLGLIPYWQKKKNIYKYGPSCFFKASLEKDLFGLRGQATAGGPQNVGIWDGCGDILGVPSRYRL